MAVLQSEFFDITGTPTEINATLDGRANISAHAQTTLGIELTLLGEAFINIIDPPGAKFVGVSSMTAAPTVLRKPLSLFIMAEATCRLANIGEATFFGGGVQTETICLEDQLSSVAPVPFELRLRTPFPAKYPTLDRLRRVVLSRVCTNTDIRAQSRALVGFTRTTDLRSMFVSLLGKPYDSASYAVCSKRKAIDVDTDLAVLYNVASDALSEMMQLGTPVPHLDLLATRLVSSTFNNRVSAVCSMVYLAAILIAERENAQ